MDEYFGAPTGKLGNPLPDGLSNTFSTISDRSIQDMARSDRVIPRQMQTGTLRGQQAVGSQELLIDSENARIGVGKIDNLENTYAVTITENGIVLNDGTNDRVLIGKDVGGF
ncbi:MAG: hypothetical protein ABIR46_03150 [Candidatus Saccharimonadales bacterium]